MKGLRSVVALAATVLMLGAAPVVAAPVSPGESSRITGTIATAMFEGGSPTVGTPSMVFVSGGDAIQKSQVKGAKPVSGPYQQVVAYATTLQDPDTGEYYAAEVWALSDSGFTVDEDLTHASLDFQADGMVVVYDPATGEEDWNGDIVALTVSAQWIGVGPLSTSKTHSKYSEPGLISIDRGKSTHRAAAVHLTLTLTDTSEVIFDGTADGEIAEVTAAIMTQYR